jgi:hypothetical protein
MRFAVILSLLVSLPLDARTRVAVRYCDHSSQVATLFLVTAFPDGSTRIDTRWVCEKDRTFILARTYINCLDDLLPCMARDLVDADTEFDPRDRVPTLDDAFAPLPLVVGSY